MSIGAVKGVEIGDGFGAARSFGSRNNDPFYADESGVHKRTNHAGGTLGGISDGSAVILRAAVKPTPSISREQGHRGQGRKQSEDLYPGPTRPGHRPPGAVVVVEAMAALTVADLLMIRMSSRLSDIKAFYSGR